MNNGCVPAISGHFNVEINIPAPEAMAVERYRPGSTARWPAFKPAAMGMDIDTLTAEQQAYLSSWQKGT